MPTLGFPPLSVPSCPFSSWPFPPSAFSLAAFSSSAFPTFALSPPAFAPLAFPTSTFPSSAFVTLAIPTCVFPPSGFASSLFPFCVCPLSVGFTRIALPLLASSNVHTVAEILAPSSSTQTLAKNSFVPSSVTCCCIRFFCVVRTRSFSLWV